MLVESGGAGRDSASASLANSTGPTGPQKDPVGTVESAGGAGWACGADGIFSGTIEKVQKFIS